MARQPSRPAPHHTAHPHSAHALQALQLQSAEATQAPSAQAPQALQWQSAQALQALRQQTAQALQVLVGLLPRHLSSPTRRRPPLAGAPPALRNPHAREHHLAVRTACRPPPYAMPSSRLECPPVPASAVPGHKGGNPQACVRPSRPVPVLWIQHRSGVGPSSSTLVGGSQCPRRASRPALSGTSPLSSPPSLSKRHLHCRKHLGS